MTHIDTNDTKGLGNTSAKPTNKTKSRKWCFTLNNYTEQDKKFLTQKLANYKYVAGFEIGEKGTPHIQGYIESKNAIRFNTLKKIIPKAHFEKARGTTKQNYDYCTKDGDFLTNIDLRTFKEKLKSICLQEYNNITWKPWQQDIIDLKQNNRQIAWYWEPNGNVGKSFLCKYLALTRNIILCEGKKNDIYNQVNTMLENEKIPTYIICDIPRTSMGFINYGILEKLKDGMIYSGKYEGGLCIFPPPTVICFANHEPDTSTMSKDRWNIKQIK